MVEADAPCHNGHVLPVYVCSISLPTKNDTRTSTNINIFWGENVLPWCERPSAQSVTQSLISGILATLCLEGGKGQLPV